MAFREFDLDEVYPGFNTALWQSKKIDIDELAALAQQVSSHLKSHESLAKYGFPNLLPTMIGRLSAEWLCSGDCDTGIRRTNLNRTLWGDFVDELNRITAVGRKFGIIDTFRSRIKTLSHGDSSPSTTGLAIKSGSFELIQLLKSGLQRDEFHRLRDKATRLRPSIYDLNF